MCLSDIGCVLEHDRTIHDALVEMDGHQQHVSTITLGLDAPPPDPGDWLVVHTGFAVERLTPAEAAEILRARNELTSDHPSRERPA